MCREPSAPADKARTHGSFRIRGVEGKVRGGRRRHRSAPTPAVRSPPTWHVHEPCRLPSKDVRPSCKQVFTSLGLHPATPSASPGRVRRPAPSRRLGNASPKRGHARPVLTVLVHNPKLVPLLDRTAYDRSAGPVRRTSGRAESKLPMASASHRSPHAAHMLQSGATAPGSSIPHDATPHTRHTRKMPPGNLCLKRGVRKKHGYSTWKPIPANPVLSRNSACEASTASTHAVTGVSPQMHKI
jgi:hypothetical protein